VRTQGRNRQQAGSYNQYPQFSILHNNVRKFSFNRHSMSIFYRSRLAARVFMG
jgi:hypothetical protein